MQYLSFLVYNNTEIREGRSCCSSLRPCKQATMIFAHELCQLWTEFTLLPPQQYDAQYSVVHAYRKRYLSIDMTRHRPKKRMRDGCYIVPPKAHSAGRPIIDLAYPAHRHAAYGLLVIEFLGPRTSRALRLSAQAGK
eukprot:6205858-Pleurochrysis_carterae.AAC.3